MGAITFHKDEVLPAQPVPDAVYFIKGGERIEVWVVDNTGVARLSGCPSHLQMIFSSSAKPPPAIEIGRYKAVENLSLDAALSAASADIAATAPASILVKRGVETVARFNWLAGAVVALVEILTPAIAKNDVLIFTAPVDQDPTLSGIAGTLTGKRS
jgi:hypothetical protein